MGNQNPGLLTKPQLDKTVVDGCVAAQCNAIGDRSFVNLRRLSLMIMCGGHSTFETADLHVRYGAGMHQGWRQYQEDAMTVYHEDFEKTGLVMFAVFDGHGTCVDA